MGFEPMTTCVVDDVRFELTREVLNIHLTLLERTDCPLFSNHRMIFKMVYSIIQTGILTN